MRLRRLGGYAAYQRKHTGIASTGVQPFEHLAQQVAHFLRGIGPRIGLAEPRYFNRTRQDDLASPASTSKYSAGPMDAAMPLGSVSRFLQIILASETGVPKSKRSLLHRSVRSRCAAPTDIQNVPISFVVSPSNHGEGQPKTKESRE